MTKGDTDYVWSTGAPWWRSPWSRWSRPSSPCGAALAPRYGVGRDLHRSAVPAGRWLAREVRGASSPYADHRNTNDVQRVRMLAHGPELHGHGTRRLRGRDRRGPAGARAVVARGSPSP
ncbi:hypothetical protein QJS66_09265 [Kocuria rhizophila]|nr:hypothetical protein QJS66_09265 [Kocuria rhizophila]